VRLSFGSGLGSKRTFQIHLLLSLVDLVVSFTRGDRFPTIILPFLPMSTSLTLSLLLVEFMIYKVSFRSRFSSFHSVCSSDPQVCLFILPPFPSMTARIRTTSRPGNDSAVSENTAPTRLVAVDSPKTIHQIGLSKHSFISSCTSLMQSEMRTTHPKQGQGSSSNSKQTNARYSSRESGPSVFRQKRSRH
jgi:hypothetical protein